MAVLAIATLTSGDFTVMMVTTTISQPNVQPKGITYFPN